MRRERQNNLVVRVDDEELDMAHAIAVQRDEPIARVVRAFIRDAYRATFGTAPPPNHHRRKPGRPASK